MATTHRKNPALLKRTDDVLNVIADAWNGWLGSLDKASIFVVVLVATCNFAVPTFWGSDLYVPGNVLWTLMWFGATVIVGFFETFESTNYEGCDKYVRLVLGLGLLLGCLAFLGYTLNLAYTPVHYIYPNTPLPSHSTILPQVAIA